MPRVREAVYECSRCKKYVPSSEHILRRVRMIGPKGPNVTQEFKAINQEYSEHLCIGCMHEELDGKQTRSARRRRADLDQDQEASASDGVQGHEQEPEGTRAA